MARTSLLAVALIAGVSTSAAAASPQRAEPQIEPRADELMHQMSWYLSNLPSFRVDIMNVDESVTTEGQKIQFVSGSRLAVRRPDRLRNEHVDTNTDTVMRYDGHEISIFGKRTGYYTTAKVPEKLDETVDFVRERFGIDAPAADLILSDPYAALMQDVRTGRYIGREPINGVPCHHLAFKGKDVDFQIWIQEGEKPLPLRYVITSKDVRAEPQFTAMFSNWEPAAVLADDLFQFNAPDGAQRVEFLTPNAARRGPAMKDKEKR
jgi:hypothetical protein